MRKLVGQFPSFPGQRRLMTDLRINLRGRKILSDIKRRISPALSIPFERSTRGHLTNLPPEGITKLPGPIALYKVSRYLWNDRQGGDSVVKRISRKRRIRYFRTILCIPKRIEFFIVQHRATLFVASCCRTFQDIWKEQ